MPISGKPEIGGGLLIRMRAEQGMRRVPTKEKVAETATFCPAYGHIGARRCQTDWGAWGVICPTLINAIGPGRFLAAAKFFKIFWAAAARPPDANAGGAAGVG